jgi:hypothetical protein
MRSFVILVTTIAIGIAAGVLVFLSPPASSPSQSDGISEAAGGRVLARGLFGGFEERKNFVLRNAEDLERLWGDLYFGKQDAPPLPSVDFSSEYVLVAFQGEQPTTGYSISISSIKDTSSRRVITFALEKPKPGCVTASAITAPYFILAYPKSDLPFEKIERVEETCANVY